MEVDQVEAEFQIYFPFVNGFVKLALKLYSFPAGTWNCQLAGKCNDREFMHICLF